MDDLVARLREAIDTEERDAARFHRAECLAVDACDITCECDCGEPERRLRRCAADRKILDLHTASSFHEARCWSCADVDDAGIWRAAPVPCGTLLALAEAYGVEARYREAIDREAARRD